MSPKEHIKRLIVGHERRKQKLEERKAKEGITVDPKVLIEIEDIEAEIEQLEAELASEPENRDLGPYQLATRRGRGAMAEIFRAYDSKLTRFVAIKVLHRQLSEDETFVDRFYNEATTVANLKHPNIVEIYDFGVDQGNYYMVMSLIEGPTLEAKLMRRRAKNQPSDLAEMSRIFDDLAGAIDYAHRRGVVHHDLKPSNIMFAEDHRVVLTDFGISRLVDVARQTATGTVFGTPAYMSPEQARGERSDTRSDIYSMGVILYEMVTGNEPVPLLISDNSGLSPAIAQVIRKALSKNPDDRYQTAGELAEELRIAIKQEGEPVSEKEKPNKETPAAMSPKQGIPRQVPETIARFNEGCSSYQEALRTWKAGKPFEYEASLRSSASQIVGALEWALKIYLQDACRGTKEYPKIKHANFHILMRLMEKYADPFLEPETIRQLYGYRDMRNAAEHDAVIPPREYLGDAIETIRRVLLTYLPVQKDQLECSEPSPPTLPSEADMPVISEDERASLQRQLENYQENLRWIDERIAEFVDPTEVPLTLLKNRKKVQQEIKGLRAQLGLN